jgi:hypothetical protein
MSRLKSIGWDFCYRFIIRRTYKCWTVLEILNNYSMGASNRVGIGLSYWFALPHRLAESIFGIRKSLNILYHPKNVIIIIIIIIYFHSVQ